MENVHRISNNNGQHSMVFSLISLHANCCTEILREIKKKVLREILEYAKCIIKIIIQS